MTVSILLKIVQSPTMQGAHAVFCVCIKYLVYILANAKFPVTDEDKSLGFLASGTGALVKNV